MTLLPLRRSEASELGRDARVESRRGLLHSIMRAPPGHSGETVIRGQIEQYGEVRHQTSRRDAIGRDQIVVFHAPSRSLVRVRREEETIDEYDRLQGVRRTQYALDELSARGHEEKRLSGRDDVRGRVEQDAPYLVAKDSSTRLTNGDDLASASD